ncbi:MAG TPA: DUF5686 family protein [Bacteroidales bacterium]|nr:DUF5686 family protein [Bacteroidales bacterium]
MSGQFRVFLCITLIATFVQGFGFAQKTPVTKIMGTAIDASTKDPIPFVNVYFAGTGVQTTTDFDGKYSIETKIAKDTLTAQYMGYVTQKKTVVKNKFQYIDFELAPTTFELEEAVILPGENPAEVILKKVIKNKELNNKEFYDAFQYEAYSKIQIDANNYSEKMTNNILLKPFQFVFENADTSTINGKVYLPVFFTETLSDIYFRRQPKASREIIKASKVSGMESSDLTQIIGDLYLKINIYDNYNVLFDKNFVSPIANFGLAYYKYYLIDSGFVNNRWCYHIKFKPRRPQELTYTGNIWINDTTFGVVKVDMRVVRDANINIINEIVVNQEFNLIDGKYWMPTVDNMIADLNLTENTSRIVGLYVHKSTSFSNFIVNKILPDNFYNEPVNILVKDSAFKQTTEYWQEHRHDSLTLQEQNIYKMVDTVKTLRAFKIYRDILFALSTNHIQIGYFELGPLLSMYSFNSVEGQRFRLGFRTSNDFSKKLMITLYGAYGTQDDKFKYGGEVLYYFRKKPNTGIRIKYSQDVEQLGLSSTAISNDMLLRSVTSRNKADKLTMSGSFQSSIEQEWFTGLSNSLYFRHRIVFPVSGEPYFKVYENSVLVEKSTFVIAEVQLNTRFAYNEKFLSGEFQRLSLGTKYPIVGVAYLYGIKNCLRSNYTYHKLDVTFSHWFNVGTLGWSQYIINAGKVWGRLPYPLLKIHEGNETYIWDKSSFNTMNYYEFISDQYLSLFYTHHFDGLLFNHIPLLKKLRWREVVYYKGLIGSLSETNKNYSVFPASSYSLKGPYQEVGVGIENIFKFFRVYGVWRLNYLNHPDIRKFMVMFTLSFYF